MMKMKIAVRTDCGSKNNLSCPIHVNRIRKKDLLEESVSKDSFEEKNSEMPRCYFSWGRAISKVGTLILNHLGARGTLGIFLYNYGSI